MKTLKHEIDNLEKELKSSKVVIKMLKNETKESESQHTKILKAKESTIESLHEYKASKISEEKYLKQREKKINKKLKNIEERESKLNLKNKHFKVDSDNNIDNSDTNSSSKLSFSNSYSAVSSVYNSSNITSYPSMLTHWLPLLKRTTEYPPFFCY